jgi:hypothetical protein
MTRTTPEPVTDEPEIRTTRRVPSTPRPGLSEPLNRLLVEARKFEAAATGSEGLQAYRISRILIGGLLDAGFTATAIASCLGTTNGSVLNRAERDGTLRLSTIRALDVLPADHPLPNPVQSATEEIGEPVYRAVELVQALGTPRPPLVDVVPRATCYGVIAG